MHSISMQDLKQFSYGQGNRLSSSHCYDIYNPVISIELTELVDCVVGNNDPVEEIQLDLSIQQLRVAAWNESLLMSMSDALLRYPMSSGCYVSLQVVDLLPLPLTRCLGVLKNIPVFAFFPWPVSLSRTFLAL